MLGKVWTESTEVGKEKAYSLSTIVNSSFKTLGWNLLLDFLTKWCSCWDAKEIEYQHRTLIGQKDAFSLHQLQKSIKVILFHGRWWFADAKLICTYIAVAKEQEPENA
jgi:hypothetical protein